MALSQSSRQAIDGLPVTNVTNLVFTVDLCRDGSETFFAARNHDAMPTPARELSGEGGADAGAAARDDGDGLLYRHTRTSRVASARCPPAFTTARSRWSPRFARRVRHVVV